jgi:hypothetical protein
MLRPMEEKPLMNYPNPLPCHFSLPINHLSISIQFAGQIRKCLGGLRCQPDEGIGSLGDGSSCGRSSHFGANPSGTNGYHSMGMDSRQGIEGAFAGTVRITWPSHWGCSGGPIGFHEGIQFEFVLEVAQLGLGGCRKSRERSQSTGYVDNETFVVHVGVEESTEILGSVVVDFQERGGIVDGILASGIWNNTPPDGSFSIFLLFCSIPSQNPLAILNSPNKRLSIEWLLRSIQNLSCVNSFKTTTFHSCPNVNCTSSPSKTPITTMILPNSFTFPSPSARLPILFNSNPNSKRSLAQPLAKSCLL